MTNFFKNLSNCLTAITITFGKKATRKNRVIANLITLVICIVTIFALVKINAFTIPTIKYGIIRFECQQAEDEGYQYYSWERKGKADEAYKQFVEESPMAKVLASIGETETVIGKILQWILFIVALAGFLVPSITAIIAAYKAVLAGQELFLINHRRSFFYNRKLEKFYREYGKKMYSSRELKRERLYKIFKNEPCIVRILSLKEAREAARKAA